MTTGKRNPKPRLIPEAMFALQLRSYNGAPDDLVLASQPVPRPAIGQVLIKIAAAPVNPSDLMFLRGLYGVKKQLPIVPGFEGSGRVVAAGGGVFSRALVGRRVACAAGAEGDGTWAEYMATDANRCILLRQKVTFEQGATMLVNPLTAWALMGAAGRDRHRAVVQTAAASALGRMIINLGRERGIPVINVVRRKEHRELLHSLGAQHVLDSSDPSFDEQLRDLCRELKATLAFDAVAGDMTGRLLRAMPRTGRAIIYGALSEGACQIDPRLLIFERKRVEGFWLSDWLRSRNAVSVFIAAMKIQNRLGDLLRTDIRERLPLADAAKGIEDYASGMTGGKILITPDSHSNTM